jgi:uncharacterized membrane protein YeiH
MNLNALPQAIEILGIVAFAVSGLVEARRKRMDMVGRFTVAFITAFGGGTLRDLLLDRRPLAWVEHDAYPLLVFVLALVLTPFLRHLQTEFSERVIVFADALGLGLFSANGTALALTMGMPPFVCVMMGVITGIFGGVLRDVICNEIPLVFRRGHLYATCAFVGCWVYMGLAGLHLPPAVCLGTGIGVTVVLRLAAVRFDWRLPG